MDNTINIKSQIPTKGNKPIRKNEDQENNDEDVDLVFKKIKRLRIQNKMSQHDLGDAINKDQYTISRMERGEYSPKPSEYRALAKALNVSPAYFFSDDHEDIYSNLNIIGYIVRDLNVLIDFVIKKTMVENIDIEELLNRLK